MLKVIILVFAFGCVSTALGHTGAGKKRFKASKLRQNKQRARLQNGVKSGELTPKEAARIRQDQRQVRRMKRRAKADGHISKKEASRIHKKQNHASKRIHRLKHNEHKRD